MTGLKEWGMDFPFNEGTPQERWLYLEYTYEPFPPLADAPSEIKIIGAYDFDTGEVELTAAQKQEAIDYISLNPPEPDDAGDDGF